jgi:riboflavin synthase
MFTGIIEGIGIIMQIKDWGGAKHIRIDNELLTSDLKLGDSVACDGICLTVIEIDDTVFEIEVMHETLQKTAAKHWQTGQRLNLERAMKAGGSFDGHIVQGHIDTTGRVVSSRNIEQALYLEIGYPKEYAGLLVPQGSIAVNGVSLTIANLKEKAFQVALIGYTLSHTFLSELKTGDDVNLEFDILGKYVQKQLQLKGSKITESWLHEQGF